jgi:hypothetical protein
MVKVEAKRSFLSPNIPMTIISIKTKEKKMLNSALKIIILPP